MLTVKHWISGVVTASADPTSTYEVKNYQRTRSPRADTMARAGTNTIATDCTSQRNTQYNHFSYAAMVHASARGINCTIFLLRLPGRYSSASNGSSVAEMLLMMRSYVFTQINSPPKQSGFISCRAQAVKELAENIAIELEGLDGDIQMTE